MFLSLVRALAVIVSLYPCCVVERLMHSGAQASAPVPLSSNGMSSHRRPGMHAATFSAGRLNEHRKDLSVIISSHF